MRPASVHIQNYVMLPTFWERQKIFRKVLLNQAFWTEFPIWLCEMEEKLVVAWQRSLITRKTENTTQFYIAAVVNPANFMPLHIEMSRKMRPKVSRCRA